MINPPDRFFSEGQSYFGSSDNPITETHCNVWDWNQLGMINLKGLAKLSPPDEDLRFRLCLNSLTTYHQRSAQ